MIGDRKKLKEANAKLSEAEARIAALETALNAAYDQRALDRATLETAAAVNAFVGQQLEEIAPEIARLEGADARDKASRDALAESMNLSGSVVRALSAIDYLTVSPEVRGLIDAASDVARRAEDVAANALAAPIERLGETVDLKVEFDGDRWTVNGEPADVKMDVRENYAASVAEAAT